MSLILARLPHLCLGTICRDISAESNAASPTPLPHGFQRSADDGGTKWAGCPAADCHFFAFLVVFFAVFFAGVFFFVAADTFFGAALFSVADDFFLADFFFFAAAVFLDGAAAPRFLLAVFLVFLPNADSQPLAYFRVVPLRVIVTVTHLIFF